MREKAVQQGIPEQPILVEDEALHTHENAEYGLEILKRYQMRRVILVTSAFSPVTYLPSLRLPKFSDHMV